MIISHIQHAKQAIAFLAIGISFAAVTVEALAQQRRDPRSGFGFGPYGEGASGMLMLAVRPDVQSELGVDSDAAKDLKAIEDDLSIFRQRAFEEAGIRPGESPSFSVEQRERVKAILKSIDDEFMPKLKAVLIGAQLKRLDEIHLQRRLQAAGPGALTVPEVASTLELNDDQIQTLKALNTKSEQKLREAIRQGVATDLGLLAKLREERDNATKEVLTDSQAKKLDTLLGKAFDQARMAVPRPPMPPVPPVNRFPPGVRAPLPKSSRNAADWVPLSGGIVDLAAREAVQQELAVSDDVARKQSSLREEYRAAFRKEFTAAGINPFDYPNAMSNDERSKYVEIQRRIENEYVSKATKLLSAEQLQRLEQIQFQSRLRSSGPSALLAPNLASELKLPDARDQSCGGRSAPGTPGQVSGADGRGEAEGLCLRRPGL